MFANIKNHTLKVHDKTNYFGRSLINKAETKIAVFIYVALPTELPTALQ